MNGRKRTVFLWLLTLGMLLTACANTPADTKEITAIENQQQTIPKTQSQSETKAQEDKAGFVTRQILNGADGDIHYSYYLPKDYDESSMYPMIVVMPGYDKMWFGEDSSGSNLNWNGVQAWTKREEAMIVVSAQLTDWGEKSARQANELTEYFIENFAVDQRRVYAAGYSAGGETMSQAVSMRPDLYAAYLHGGAQWDGSFTPIAEHGVAVYIFMAENDEYYGSQKARDAYEGLHHAYEESGLTEEQINDVLQLEIPDNAYFNRLGIYNYHGGGIVVFDDETILNWMTQKEKQAVREAIDEGIIRREDIFVTTKIYPGSEMENPEQSVQSCLDRLNIDYVDMMLLHHPDGNDVKAYKAMEQFVKDGKIRSIGLSNWYVEELTEFLPQVDTVPALVQNEIHPYYQVNDVIPFIQDLGIVVQGWYPLGGRGHTTELLGDEVITQIAEAHGKSSAQVILRWNLQKGVVVIPGSSNPDHIRENTELFDFELTEDEMNQMNALDRGEKHDWY